MDPEAYDSDVMDIDADEEDEGYNEEVDDMLDAMMAEADEDLAERRARRRRRGGLARKRAVRTASGKSAYRAPTQAGLVSQTQFKEAMTRVGDETRRNAEGIKTVNDRVGKLDGRVQGVVTVATAQGRKLGSLDRRMKLDAALDFAQSFNVETGTDGSVRLAVPDLTQLLKSAVKSGVLGDGKGALGNPWVVGGIGLALRPNLLSSLVPK